MSPDIQLPLPTAHSEPFHPLDTLNKNQNVHVEQINNTTPPISTENSSSNSFIGARILSNDLNAPKTPTESQDRPMVTELNNETLLAIKSSAEDNSNGINRLLALVERVISNSYKLEREVKHLRSEVLELKNTQRYTHNKRAQQSEEADGVDFRSLVQHVKQRKRTTPRRRSSDEYTSARLDLSSSSLSPSSSASSSFESDDDHDKEGTEETDDTTFRKRTLQITRRTNPNKLKRPAVAPKSTPVPKRGRPKKPAAKAAKTVRRTRPFKKRVIDDLTIYPGVKLGGNHLRTTRRSMKNASPNARDNTSADTLHQNDSHGIEITNNNSLGDHNELSDEQDASVMIGNSSNPQFMISIQTNNKHPSTPIVSHVTRRTAETSRSNNKSNAAGSNKRAAGTSSPSRPRLPRKATRSSAVSDDDTSNEAIENASFRTSRTSQGLRKKLLLPNSFDYSRLVQLVHEGVELASSLPSGEPITFTHSQTPQQPPYHISFSRITTEGMMRFSLCGTAETGNHNIDELSRMMKDVRTVTRFKNYHHVSLIFVEAVQAGYSDATVYKAVDLYMREMWTSSWYRLVEWMGLSMERFLEVKNVVLAVAEAITQREQ